MKGQPNCKATTSISTKYSIGDIILGELQTHNMPEIGLTDECCLFVITHINITVVPQYYMTIIASDFPGLQYLGEGYDMNIGSMDEAEYFMLAFEESKDASCTCDLRDIMIRGCKCGGV